MDSLEERVASLLGLAVDEVREIARRSPDTYRMYRVRKRSGVGERIIHHPWKQTKMLQYALMICLRPSLGAHQSAMAFREQLASPLRRNAEMHSQNEYLVRIDFEDFFPSITPVDLYTRLTFSGNPRQIALTPIDEVFLKDVCFIKRAANRFGLPIGAPISPMISNGIMFDLDVQLAKLASQLEFTYTRYADDLVFSTNRKGVSKELVKQVDNILRKCECPRLKINTRKTRFMSRNCRRAVTGMLITPEGSISIGRARKRTIRALVHRSIHGQLPKDEKASLQGWLAYILDVEPAFFNRLCNKYSTETINGILRRGVSR